MARPTQPARLRVANFQPSLTFEEAWNQASAEPRHVYRTGGRKAFTVRAAITGRGPRRGERVLRFMRPGGESARAYEECWGCITNVNRTYIDVYTSAMHRL